MVALANHFLTSLSDPLVALTVVALAPWVALAFVVHRLCGVCRRVPASGRRSPKDVKKKPTNAKSGGLCGQEGGLGKLKHARVRSHDRVQRRQAGSPIGVLSPDGDGKLVSVRDRG